MPTSTGLELKNVLNALSELSVDKMKGLLIQCGVELHVLNDIRSQYRESYECKAHYIQAWLDDDLEASWEKIVDGLKKIKMAVMASKIASQYLVATDGPSLVTNHPCTQCCLTTSTAVQQPASVELSQYHSLVSADPHGIEHVMDILTAVTLKKYDVVVRHIKAGHNLDLQNERGESALMRASSEGRTEFLVMLVEAGVNIDLQNERGMSALMRATCNRETKAVAVLLKARANLDLQDKEGNSAVILATQLHYSDILKELVKAGANPNLQNKDGLTALITAVTRRWASDLTDTRILLAGKGTNTDLQDHDGQTALIEAASRGKSDVVVELLKAGAQVDQKNKRGESALIKATSQGKPEAVRELIKFKADPNLEDQDGQTALIEAASRGKADVVVELLKAGAQVDQKNKKGESALIRATRQGKIEVVRQLIKFGANLNIQDQRGDTAAIIATQIPRPDVLQVLVSAGADLNLQNDEGLTALMISARGWGTELTDILLKGAEIHMNYDFRESRRGWSALFFSVESGNIAATQSLLKEDANTQLRDKNGSTVLDVATALAGKYADRSHACHGLHHRLASICSVLRSTTTECPNLQTLRNLVRRSRRKVEKVLKPSEKKLYGVHMRSNDKAAYQRRREIMSW